MRRAGERRERRNRNIGTTKQGHGQDNRLVVPSSRHDVRWPDSRLRNAVRVAREVDGKRVHFLVEPTREDSGHACTIDDVVQVLRMVPREDHDGIDVFVLRQPTRKEEILRPAWGRLVWSFGDLGPAIVLDAISPGGTFDWTRRVSPADAAELDRFRDAGFPLVSTRRKHTLTMTLDAVRALQLFHTLLHEMGHFIDYERRRKRGEEASYSARPSAEREAFAHRHADERRAELRAWNRVPFERIVSERSLARDGLDERWFGEMQASISHLDARSDS